jgi:tellurite resistance protein TehA-like permease
MHRSRAAVGRLSPGYFALVMASGIISDGLHQTGAAILSTLLLVVAAISFVLLVVLNGWRLARFRRYVVLDFFDPERAFGYFTLVAGAGVLGSRLAAGGQTHWALALFVIAIIGWLLLGYGVPWATMLDRGHRSTVRNANGSWFLWVVASQSVAALAAILERELHRGQHLLSVLSVVAWSVGVFLYGAESLLIALREMLYDADFAPSYWVAMGAASITVLAGAELLDAPGTAIIGSVHAVVDGATVMFWALATWLVPMLVVAFCWRHLWQRDSLAYDVNLWSMVFPLGMYAVASMELGRAEGLPWVEQIGQVELWVAFAVWTVTFLGMLAHLYRTVLRPADPVTVQS